MKLKVLGGERFSCHGCTDCCRDWHVELLEGEEVRLTGLSWPAGDELHGKKVILKHGGRSYVAHRGDGSCVYLNLANGRCRVHEAFGAGAKPVGCRLFPFSLARTFGDQVTVMGRYDCPSVQKNEGAGHEESVAELTAIARQVGITEGLSEETVSLLEEEQVEAITGFASAMLGTFEQDAQRAIFLVYLCEWLMGVKVGELDRETLGKGYGVIREAVEKSGPGGVERLDRTGRLAFRSLWAMYLRRDEEVLDGRAGRVGRMMAQARVSVLGWGGLKGLGLKNPGGTIGRSGIFKGGGAGVEKGAFDVHWRMVRNKLDSMQFMGAANHGKGLLEGMRSLALMYPLVFATAKVRAGGRVVSAEDVRVGVGAIEHGFGRSAMLGLGQARMLEARLVEGGPFASLAWGV